MRGFFKIVILFFVLLFATEASSQAFTSFYSESEVTKDTSRFSLHINNTNFFKNNEYFNNFVDGYTLIGYFLQPKMQFRVNDKLSLFAGLHIQKYSGIEKFSEFTPTFTLQFNPSEKTSILFGTINSAISHKLNDYVYGEEFYLTNNVENGIQILHNGDRFKSDTWVDWRQFIFKGSEYPEILLFGTSNTFTLLKSNDKPILDFSFSAVASHVGGQIDASDVSVETIGNTISGLGFYLYPSSKICNKVNLFSHYHTSMDASPGKRLKYLYGYGILSGIELSNNFADIRLEHWFGEYYFSKFGNPMYQSITPKSTTYTEDQRAFAIAHMFYKNESIKNLKIGLGLDFYYDLYNMHLDYSFGFYLKSNFRFNLDKKHRK